MVAFRLMAGRFTRQKTSASACSSQQIHFRHHIMSRRVVVTGIGIASCLGTDVASVTQSLREGRSGISFQQEQVDVGMRSHIAGAVDIDLKEHIDLVRGGR